MRSVWKCKTINVPHHYRVCPFCEWTWEETRDRWIPKFCGGCGKRLFTEEEIEEGDEKWDASCENCEYAYLGADPLKIIQDSKYLFYCAAGHAYGGSETICSEWRRKER